MIFKNKFEFLLKKKIILLLIMSFYRELEYTEKIDKVINVQFGIMGPDEIRSRSVAEITTQETYVGNQPVVGGLHDPRMWAQEGGKLCQTDQLDCKFCPGYFGHIELAKPVFHIHFLPVIQKIIRCVCIRCGQLLIDKNCEEIQDLLRKKGKQRWLEIFNMSQKIKRCGSDSENGCGCRQPDKYYKEGVAKIYAEWKEMDIEKGQEGAKKQLLTAEYLLRLFKRLTDEDCDILGFSKYWCRPDWMICQVLPVAPPTVRPSVKQDNNQRMEDDLTHKLVDIIKTNKTLKQKIESNATQQIIDEWTSVLQYHIATYIDNEIPGVATASQRSGRPLKSIRQRLKTKEGRIRGNLMGKRVDYSARSVITPDPNIRLDELGVPKQIAMNLTYPEIVTPYNITLMYECVQNGPNKYPGAKTIKKKSDGSMISLKHVDTKSIRLQYGDIINRHLRDGDTVLFNRQPSLHRMSMMGHKVRVMDYSTFRLNVSVTSPYNADFDGDEMNMHVPQSIQTHTELSLLPAVPFHIISPRENKPVIGIVQDTLLGVNRLTKNLVKYNHKDYMNTVMWNSVFNGEIKDKDHWDGQDLMSSILPKINIMMSNNSYDEQNENVSSDNFVKIENGEIKQGILDKGIFTKTSRGLVHVIFNDYGPHEASNFLNNTQNIVTNYLLKTGFSVGVSDLIADEVTLDYVSRSIDEQKKEVSNILQHVHLNIFENLTGKKNSEEFESKIMNTLKKAIKKGGNIGLESLDKNNRMVNMVRAGSKGSELNIAQMVACLGQQAVDGKRIPYGFTDRTLPHYSRYDDTPESRGFVESSFMKGLTPQEFFFHAMGGREGLIDTAVKTSETGYIQRKLIKAMEDLRINYDLTVRNASNGIVQFIYGEDGMDSIKIESQMLKISQYSYADFVSKFKFKNDEIWESFLNSSAIKNMKSTQKWQDKLTAFFKQLLEDQHQYITYISKNNPSDAIFYPINLQRLILNTTSSMSISNKLKTDLNPCYLIDKVDELCDQLYITKSVKGNMLFKILLRHYLNPVSIIKEKRITVDAFNYICHSIKDTFYKSFCQPGEMVGAIAAQSIGEPATQMTLNTFHFAGIGDKSNVTRGVPRLKELLHISKNPKNPSLTVYLKPEYSFDKEKAQEILHELELTTLKDITHSTSIYYDPSDFDTIIEEDKELLSLYNTFQEIDPVCHDNDSNSDWVLRIELNRKIMLDKKITMQDVYFCIDSVYNEDISCIFSDDNASNLIFRIRINHDISTSSENEDDIILLRTLERNLLDKIILKGINNINKVTMRQDRNYGEINENNQYVKKPQWVLDTDGVNLQDVLNHPIVDYTKTFSNDIYEVYDNFGIEAARYALFKEINDVIRFEGAYVNYRHLSLLVDTMTSRGSLMSIDRHGINRGDIGPLAKCSFEETTDQLLKASIFGEVDKVTGVSSNIMMGQVAPCGTGYCNIVIDEPKLIELLKTSKPLQKEEEVYEDSDSDDEDDGDDYCNDDMLQFSFNPNNTEKNISNFNTQSSIIVSE